MTSFKDTTEQLCKNPLAFMREKAMNIAGAGWVAGGLEQLAFSGFNLSPWQALAAAINISSASSNMVFGGKDYGVRIGCSLGELGAVVTLGSGLVSGDAATWIGFAPFTVAQAAGIFSPELTKKFEESGNALVRNTLGSPRRILGFINAASRVPIIIHGVLSNQPEITVPYMTWLAADLSAMLSKSERSKTRQIQAAPN